jgi:hypothetical protein
VRQNISSGPNTLPGICLPYKVEESTSKVGAPKKQIIILISSVVFPLGLYAMLSFGIPSTHKVMNVWECCPPT